MSRILHISDTHGRMFPLYGSYDFIVHSGDFFPDPPGNPQFKSQIGDWQLEWLENNILNFQQWLMGHDFLFTLGNHDWADPHQMVKMLAKYGINAICLHDKITNYHGIKLYGFPYVPDINGNWNYELAIPEMKIEVNKMVEKLKSTNVDVIVAHSAIANCLDLIGIEHLGSSVIANALDYQIPDDKMPSHYLHGHLHSSHGIALRRGLLVSNAATVKHILEI